MTKRIDVAVVREAITKLVSLMTAKNITVTQRGTKAYVEYTPGGKIKRLNVPYLPDDASEEFIAAVQGFVDHEVGHVLHTDPAIVQKAHKLGSSYAGMHNVIEDTYIERMQQQAFHGSKNTLDAVRKFHIEKISGPKIIEALAAGDNVTASGYLIVLVFRAWAGQRLAKEYVSSTPELAKLTAQLESKVGMDLLAKLGQLKSSRDCFDLTAEVLKRMETPKPKPPETKPEPEPKHAPEPKSEPTKEAAEPETPPAAEEKTEPESEAGPTEERTTPEDESAPPEDGKGTPGDDETSEADEPAGDDDSDPAGSGEGAAGDEAGLGDAGDEDDEPTGGSGDEVSESTESQKGDDGFGTASGSDDEPDDDEAAGPGGESAPDEPSHGPVEEGDTDEEAGAQSEAGGHGSSRGEETAAPVEPGQDVSLDEIFDRFIDFDEAVSEGLSKEAKIEMDRSICPVFSRDFDKIEPLPYQATESRTRDLIQKVTPMVAPMAKSLQRALAAQEKLTWNPGQRRGRIAPGALFRVATGDDRVFRTRYETKAKNTAVSLVVDCSGSMRNNDRIISAFQAAFALSSTLDRLKIKHEVIGFTTTMERSGEMHRAARAEGMGTFYARGEPLHIPVFKGFNEKLGFLQQSRMAYMTTYEATELLRHNVDGESLRVAAQRLSKVQAERRIIMVLSDGHPACADMDLHSRETARRHYELAGNQDPLFADLKMAVRETTDAGIEVVGIGIQHAGVSQFYPKSVNLTSVSKLPTVVMEELTKLLLS